MCMRTKKSRILYSFLYMELVSVNAYAFLSLCNVLELNLSVDQCIKCIIGTVTNVLSGANLGSALSDDDVAGDNVCTVSLLNAKTLGFTVAAVLGGTYTFFMSKELQTQFKHLVYPPFKFVLPITSAAFQLLQQKENRNILPQALSADSNRQA